MRNETIQAIERHPAFNIRINGLHYYIKKIGPKEFEKKFGHIDSLSEFKESCYCIERGRHGTQLLVVDQLGKKHLYRWDFLHQPSTVEKLNADIEGKVFKEICLSANPAEETFEMHPESSPSMAL